MILSSKMDTPPSIINMFGEMYTYLRNIWRAATIHHKLATNGYDVKNIIEVCGTYMIEVSTNSVATPPKSLVERIIPNINTKAYINDSGLVNDNYHINNSGDYQFDFVLPDAYIESNWNPYLEVSKDVIGVLNVYGYDAKSSTITSYNSNNFWLEVQFHQNR